MESKEEAEERGNVFGALSGCSRAMCPARIERKRVE